MGCHKEFETEYDLEDHEETHRDSPWSDFICETCGEAIQCKDYAQIHYFCHNTPEILEGIRKYKGDTFKKMMNLAPKIISDIMNNSPPKKHIETSDTGFEDKNDLKDHEKAIHNHDQQDGKS